jgi:hypothetical protein
MATKDLSELLMDLAQQSKKVEDAFAAIADDTDAAAERRREKTRAAAAAAAATLDQGVATAGDTAASQWRALQARMHEEITGIQQGMAERRHQRDVGQAEQQADAAKARAVRAIAFASAAVQTAEVAALDAAVAQREADALKQR